MTTTTSEAPQDSVLRRHWEASRQQPQSTSSTSSDASETPSSGGFFAWIKSLFS